LKRGRVVPSPFYKPPKETAMAKQTPSHKFQLINDMSMFTTMTIKGKEVSIVFNGGFRRPYRYNGYYITDNPDIIKAIKQSNGYGSQYVQVFPVEGEDEVAAPAETPAETPAVTDPGANELDMIGIGDGINTGQKARAWILKNFQDVNTGNLRTNAEIRKVAEEKGIKFTEWIEE